MAGRPAARASKKTCTITRTSTILTFITGAAVHATGISISRTVKISISRYFCACEYLRFRRRRYPGRPKISWRLADRAGACMHVHACICLQDQYSYSTSNITRAFFRRKIYESIILIITRTKKFMTVAIVVGTVGRVP